MTYYVLELAPKPQGGGYVTTGGIKSVVLSELTDQDFKKYFPQVWDIECKKLASKLGVDLEAMRKEARKQEFMRLHGLDNV